MVFVCVGQHLTCINISAATPAQTQCISSIVCNGMFLNVKKAYVSFRITFQPRIHGYGKKAAAPAYSFVIISGSKVPEISLQLDMRRKQCRKRNDLQRPCSNYIRVKP
jgi:hypothetical protein